MTNIVFNLPPLPDNDVWWANYAAWVAYWQNGSVTADIGVATPTEAGAVLQAATTIFNPPNNVANLIIDGNQVPVPTQDSFKALQDDYIALKTALKNSGAISNA